MARIVVLLAIGLCLGLAVYFWPAWAANNYRSAPEKPQLKTGGTAAILVVAENFWKGKYLKEKNVEITCDSVGSTKGTSGMLEGAYSIAFTHAPASAELREKAKQGGREIVHIPLMLCGVAPAYHIDGLKTDKPLNFTGEILADIFLGKIPKWNDPAIKAVNPGVELPEKKIVVFHREESSGTTKIFTEYLAAVSPEWREKIGPGADTAKWPTGNGAPRNQGVAIAVYSTDGAIGYVDRMYVTLQDLTLTYGAVQNHDKTAFILAEPANTTAAVRSILSEIPDDFTFSLADRPGKDSYPIAGVIYAQCCIPLKAHRQEVVDFLRWAVHDGQESVAMTNFAPLPSELIPRIEKLLDAMQAAK